MNRSHHIYPQGHKNGPQDPFSRSKKPTGCNNHSKHVPIEVRIGYSAISTLQMGPFQVWWREKYGVYEGLALLCPCDVVKEPIVGFCSFPFSFFIFFELRFRRLWLCVCVSLVFSVFLLISLFDILLFVSSGLSKDLYSSWVESSRVGFCLFFSSLWYIDCGAGHRFWKTNHIFDCWFSLFSFLLLRLIRYLSWHDIRFYLYCCHCCL